MIINGKKIHQIHIPKTGGKGLMKMLAPYRVEQFNKVHGHFTYIEEVKRLGTKLDEYITFTTIRNPWDWHVSHFFYLKQYKPSEHGHFIEHELFQKFEFRDYVHWLVSDNPKSKQGFIEKNLLDWCIDDKGKISIDEILRLENINHDWNTFCEKYGFPKLKYPHTNKSKRKSYHEYYDDETMKIIQDKHKRDIEKFNYKFI